MNFQLAGGWTGSERGLIGPLVNRVRQIEGPKPHAMAVVLVSGRTTALIFGKCCAPSKLSTSARSAWNSTACNYSSGTRAGC